jgi:hypothetical protein
MTSGRVRQILSAQRTVVLSQRALHVAQGVDEVRGLGVMPKTEEGRLPSRPGSLPQRSSNRPGAIGLRFWVSRSVIGSVSSLKAIGVVCRTTPYVSVTSEASTTMLIPARIGTFVSGSTEFIRCTWRRSSRMRQLLLVSRSGGRGLIRCSSERARFLGFPAGRCGVINLRQRSGKVGMRTTDSMQFSGAPPTHVPSPHVACPRADEFSAGAARYAMLTQGTRYRRR